MMYQNVGRQDDVEMAYLRAVALEPDEESTFIALKKTVEDSGREYRKSLLMEKEY